MTKKGNEINGKETWIFTFGFGHTHPVTGERLGNRFVAIEGDIEETRRIMAEHFGDKWSMQYPGVCEAGVHKYGLTQIPLPVKEAA